ncbi:hypothetical protein FG386_003199 [Cryptosporidium ryanae]|uniref:uncharacterized protein n=1 Tax=Cryptosporidium ryanae TaxID=515981 RepID=UPI00351A835F|nr:hypothetical protein FG386_003199 [Cryptosporidium ryanae]
MNLVTKNKSFFDSISKEEYEDAVNQLCSPDSVMDESIFDYIQVFISYNMNFLKQQKNLEVNSLVDDNEGQPPGIAQKHLMECLNLIIESYVGFAPICQVLSEWIGILDETPDLRENLNTSMGNSSNKSRLNLNKKIKLQKQESNFNNKTFSNMVEPIAHLIERYFNTEALRKYMDENRDLLGQGGWQPPPCYWSLMKHPTVVKSIQKLFLRNRKSEFLLAFLQDIHNFSKINPNIEFIPKNMNYSSTSNFSVFTKNVTELLSDFLLTDETVEAALQGINSLPLSGTVHNPLLSLNINDNTNECMNNSIAHYICSTFSQSENAYFYAQALLHYMIIWRGDYSGCRRLSQMLYHYVRVTLKEPRVAQLNLLFTNLTNFPELFKLCKTIFKMETTSDVENKLATGGLGGFESAVKFPMNPGQISNLYDILKGIIDRFESLQILLYERERFKKSNNNEISSENIFVKETTTNLNIEGQCSNTSDIDNRNKWESLGSLGFSLSDLELVDFPEKFSEKEFDTSGFTCKNRQDIQKEKSDSMLDENSRNNLQTIEPMISNYDSCSIDETIFDMPSVSRMGDVPGSDEIRRLKTGPERPPMDALRESALLETLIDILANQNIWLTPEEQSKTIDLLLLLSVYSPYELLLFLEEQKEWNTISKESSLNCNKTDIWSNSEEEIEEGNIKTEIDTLSEFISSESSNSSKDVANSFNSIHDKNSNLLIQEKNCPRNINIANSSIVGVEKNNPESIVGCKSTIDSCIYRNAHNQKILGSLQSLSKSKAKKMREQFQNLRDLCCRYKQKARKELFSIYHIIHDNLIKNDLKWAYFDGLITTPIGASTILRYIEVFLFSGSQNDTPLMLLSSSILVLLKHIAQWHQKKRICIFHLLRLCLEYDLHEFKAKNNFMIKSLILTKSERKRWIIDFFVYLVGGGLYNPVLTYMSQVGIKYLDKSLIRDFTIKVSDYCGPPYSIDFSISFLSLLTSAHELEVLDLISFCKGNSNAPQKLRASIIEIVTIMDYLESTNVAKGKSKLNGFLFNRTNSIAHLKYNIHKITEMCKLLKQAFGKSIDEHIFRGKGLGKTWYQSHS